MPCALRGSAQIRAQPSRSRIQIRERDDPPGDVSGALAADAGRDVRVARGGMRRRARVQTVTRSCHSHFRLLRVFAIRRGFQAVQKVRVGLEEARKFEGSRTLIRSTSVRIEHELGWTIRARTAGKNQEKCDPTRAQITPPPPLYMITQPHPGCFFFSSPDSSGSGGS